MDTGNDGQILGSVASLRAKFGDIGGPVTSLPSSVQASEKRASSYSSLISSKRSSISDYTNLNANSLPIPPYVENLSSSSPRAPPLPSRPQNNMFSTPTSVGSTNSPSSGLSNSVSELIFLKRPPVRPPPRHGSVPVARVDSIDISLKHSDNTQINSPNTLQVPPPLPARKSPPSESVELPRQARLFPDIHQTEGGEDSARPISPSLESRVKNATRFAPPPVRIIGLGDKLPPPKRPPSNEDSESDSGDEEDTIAKSMRASDLLPDSTHSSRRPPYLRLHRFLYARIPVAAHQGVIAVSGFRVVVAHHHVKIYDLSVSETYLHNIDLKEAGFEWRGKEPRITSVEFRPSEDSESGGRFVWLGTKDGSIWELDTYNGLVIALKPSLHSAAVTHIFRHGRNMISLDETGKVLVFSPEPEKGGYTSMLTHSTPRVIRISEKQGFARIMHGLLWTSGGPGSGSTNSQANGYSTPARGPVIRVVDLFGHSTNPRSLLPSENVGSVTSGTILQSAPGRVFLGHEGGIITVWDLDSADVPQCIDVVKVSSSDVLCLEGVCNRLWAGGRKGQIVAYDIQHRPWSITNIWTAHADLPVQKLFIDPFSISTCGQLTVVSVGRDEQARFWDGLLGSTWIDTELQKRELSFSSYRPLNILVVSWNVDAAKPDSLTGCDENTNFLNDVLSSVDSPDIIVFGFQELIDLESRKMAAKTVLLGGKKKMADGTISEKVSRSYRMWHDRLVLAVRLAMPSNCPYTVVHAENLVGLFTCVFVKNSELGGLRDVAITTVKRGIGGMYGNKGGIVARLVIDDSSICFINCHLAAGQQHVRARNADVAAVLEDKEVFPKTSTPEAVAYAGGGDGTMITDHEIVFLNGDLNYRIDQRREAAIAAVNQGQLELLLAHDQLLKEMNHNRGFRLRSFNEAPITFPPTYKYDRRSSVYDTSEKSRVPAWCDRILYRSRNESRVQTQHYKRYEANVSDHRPISAGFTVTVKSVDLEARSAVKSELEEKWSNFQVELLSNAVTFFAKQLLI